jgi:hypothetical protein
MASRHSRKSQATRVEASDSEDGHQSSQEADILKTAQNLVENVRVSMKLDVSIYSNLSISRTRTVERSSGKPLKQTMTSASKRLGPRLTSTSRLGRVECKL